MKHLIESILKEKKYIRILPGTQKNQTLPELARETMKTGVNFYATKYTGFQSIYGVTLRADFFIYNPKKFPDGLLIECKGQQAGGNIDEKLPFIVYSLKNIPCPSMLMMAGDRLRKCAVDWAINQSEGRFTGMYGMDAIDEWANSCF